jgi:integrase
VSRKSSRKAVRVVRHTLADGTTKEYRYPAYKRKRRARRGDTVGDLLAAWQTSPEWRALKPSTQAGYVTYAAHLLGMQHVDMRRITRREMTDIRNALARVRGNGAATGFVRAASAMFGWAIENGWLDHSPMHKVKRLAGGTLPAWTPEEAALAIQHLPEHLRRPVVLALYTGQRRIDLIRMPWNSYNGHSIRLTQQKTGTPLVIPVHPTLKVELDAWRRLATSTLILTNRFGLPWRDSNLSKQIGDALARIPRFPAGRNIHGLRKLAAASLAEAGCTINEIAAVTGHKSLGMLRLYTASADQERLAGAAIVRWGTNAKMGLKSTD